MNNKEINSIKNNKMNKKKIIVILIILVVFSLLIIGYIKFINKKEHLKEQNNKELLENQLVHDYNNGNINEDQYVLYNLYAQFDKSLLDTKYQKSFDNNVAIHIEDLINKHYDELSESTLRYFAKKINLDSISFEIKKENSETNDSKVALSDFFIETVYAKSESTTNLNKAVLSSNGNFVVWYTTTGDSKTTYENAKKIADGLEKTINNYTKLFNKQYKYNSKIISKGKRYKDQIEILQKENIDTNYLESAMQVYLVNYGGDSLAQYISGYGKGEEILSSIFGGDSNGTIAYPYILIKPNKMNDYERLEQVYSHELFHHYQHNLLCDVNNCNLSDSGLIVEGTANWASALSTTKTTSQGFLNEWAGVARYQSNGLIGSYLKNYGDYTAGYAFYIFLNAYSTNVENGVNKIINSLYQSDPLDYLERNCTSDEVIKIQEYIALKNLNQDYDNMNFLVSLNSPITEIFIKGNLTDKYKSNDTNINKLGISYYLLNQDSSSAYQINFIRDNYYIGAVIISEDINDNYKIVDKADNTNTNYTFDTNKYGEYEKLYLVIYNKKLTLNNYYSISVNKITKNNLLTNNSNYISLIDCDAYYSEEIDKRVDTYFFDENNNVKRWVISIYLNKSVDPIDQYNFYANHKNFTNVKIKGNLVIAEYTSNALSEYFNNLTRDSVIYSHGTSCSLSCNDDECSWENNPNLVLNYNPDSIN